jgi:glutamate/tyrosine decarboxylase-like PLP-dependent enzyme
VATAGPRYFGFVTGGSLPATLASSVLAAAWDQNAFNSTSSPAAVAIEAIAESWLIDLLGLPEGCATSFTTGASLANFSALAAARHACYRRLGWDVEARGLFGAPELKVYLSDEQHPTVHKALGLLGFGRERVVRLPVDAQGRIRIESLPEIETPAIVCAQAGNVNSGAFDPFSELAAWCREGDAWLHIDGAFGLWAVASPAHRFLTEGIELADSWATDAHKWLNVPYDSGLAFVRDADALRAAMSFSAAYLPEVGLREPFHTTPEASRRGRGVEIWAALRSLGRSGVADLIDGCCRHARSFETGLRAAGFEVLNDVVLNQVVVSFGDAEQTGEVIRTVQDEGICWCGPTEWRGQAAMRISVSSWATRERDVERSLESILRCADRVGRGSSAAC